MDSAQPQLRRLRRIEVDGLFGLYDHRIDLALDDRVTLLHGPNGVGKTTILRIVDALLRDRIADLQRIPFRRLAVEFRDQAVLELTKDNGERADFDGGSIRLSANGEQRTTSINLAPRHVEATAARVDFLEPLGEDAWIDVRDGEVLTDSDVMRRFGRAASTGDRTGDDSREPWLRDFLGATNSLFIETQRLIQSRHSAPMRARRPQASFPRVVECSRQLKRRVDDTMADYGRQAQTLDQSFPQRLLQTSVAGASLSVDEIRDRMSDLDQRTKELKEIGILDETPIDQFRPGDIDESQAGVMTMYLSDTEKKLHVLEDLAHRVQLLLGSLNGKYQHKQMRVDREQGLAVTDDRGRVLPLESLSSGEQHELILHYDLLFRVPPNTVVLLDEPELSLHIEWQNRFLSDLMAIIELSSFDAVVATHSPDIVGNRDDLMVELAV